MSPESEYWPEHCGKKMVKLEGRFDDFLLEIIACEVCGGDTTMTGTKLCNRCHELGSAWRSLVHKDREAAREWLKARTAELEEGTPCEA